MEYQLTGNMCNVRPVVVEFLPEEATKWFRREFERFDMKPMTGLYQILYTTVRPMKPVLVTQTEPLKRLEVLRRQSRVRERVGVMGVQLKKWTGVGLMLSGVFVTIWWPWVFVRRSSLFQAWNRALPLWTFVVRPLFAGYLWFAFPTTSYLEFSAFEVWQVTARISIVLLLAVSAAEILYPVYRMGRSLLRK